MQDLYQSIGAQLALDGLNRSLEDVDEQDFASAQIAVGQGLFWAISLDDRLVKRFPEYRAARDLDDDGRYADGARLARNAIAHGTVVMQSHQPGISLPIVLPFTLGGLRWRPIEDVIAEWPDRIDPPPAQLESYSRYFTGLQPSVPVATVRNWLMRAPVLGFTL